MVAGLQKRADFFRYFDNFEQFFRCESQVFNWIFTVPEVKIAILREKWKIAKKITINQPTMNE